MCIGSFRTNSTAFKLLQNTRLEVALNTFNWLQPGAIKGLQDFLKNSGVSATCINEAVSMYHVYNRCLTTFVCLLALVDTCTCYNYYDYLHVCNKVRHTVHNNLIP